MKQRFLLGAFLVVFSATAKAQINKGMWTIGGSAQYSSSESNSQKSTQWNAFPSIGYTFKQNSVIGISFNYGKSRSENIGSTGFSENSSYGIGAFYMRYFPIVNRFYAFGIGNIGFGQLENEVNNGVTPSVKTRSKSYGLGISPGFAYAISQRFLLETYLSNFFSVSYLTYMDGAQKSLNVGIYANPSANLNLGLRFFLGSSKPSATTE